MDTLIAFLTSLGPQHWLVLGLILLIAEMVTGTSYLLWPAVAAFITALLSFFGFTNWLADMGLFALMVIGLTAFGRPLVQRWRTSGGSPTLNERSTALIGVRGIVQNFGEGVGSVKVNDTVWRFMSEDALAPGQHVEVTSVDGATLKVKRV